MTIQFFFSTPSVTDVMEPQTQPFNQEPFTTADGQTANLQGEPPSSLLAQSVPQPEPAEPLNPPVSPEAANPSSASAETDEPGEEPDELVELREQLTHSSSPTEGMYLNAIRAHEQAGKIAEALQITREGREAFPDSDSLLLSESDLLAASGKPEKAWLQLARTGRVGDRQFASRILKFGVSAKKYDETLVILSSAGTREFEWSQDDWLSLVRLYENTGQIDLAIRTARENLNDEAELNRLETAYPRAKQPGKPAE